MILSASAMVGETCSRLMKSPSVAWKRPEIVARYTLYYAHALTDAAPRPDLSINDSKEDT